MFLLNKIINDADTIQDIITFAEKVQDLFREPFDILGQKTYVTTSIGIAVYPLHGSTIEMLLQKADLAMYISKKEGRNTFRFFSNSMDEKGRDKRVMRTKRRIAQMEETALNNFFPLDGDSSMKSQLEH